ncbi:TerB N-terminal domain-containing protein [Desulfovibrio sp. Huiquan2017]|uniref:tellurite resistance TerB family protein n=1 Tax=Desulfovibrio sp. Huiquan2017 TaxID=2816861 RepID=UPI001A92532F|nr:TerB N-terminal domain-containing protein [Desulfovibrio sp. Huiquan2017]
MGNAIVAVLIIWLIVHFIKKASAKKKAEQQLEEFTSSIEVRVTYSDDDYDDYNFKATQSDEQCWIPPGQSVEIYGHTIKGGMLYVGTGLGTLNGYGADPALINPELPRSSDRSCTENFGMSYWPSYSRISPEARAAYIDWLAKGRRVEGAYIGYVFLFFYGLERRVLHSKPGNEELLRIRDEASELLAIYGDNRSFRQYSENFLGLVSVLIGDGTHKSEINPNKIARGIYPPSFTIELGRNVAEGKPIPWNLALEWVLRDPETRLRVPAKRCPHEFAFLFKTLYQEKFGEGMVVPPNKKKIRLEYHPASSSLRGFSSDVDIPDPSGLKRPLGNLWKLVDQSMSELEAYSRLMGKDPEAAKGIAGIALLPGSIAMKRKSAELDALRQYCNSALAGKDMGTAQVNALIEMWPTKTSGKLTKAEASQTANILGALGIGMEPDPRRGGRTPAAGDEIILFKLPEGTEEAPGTGYHQAIALVHLTGLVAAADGDVSPEERSALNSHLASSLGLSPTETLRLTAFFEWIIARPPSMAGMKAKLAGLSAAQREKVADFLISVAGADGVIHPKEITILEKIYKTMGMEPKDVQTHIHRFLANGDSQPVTVKDADTGKTGYSIPPAPGASPEADVKLDADRLRLKREQTKEVAELLEDVFTDDVAEPEPEAEKAPDFYGLGAPYKDILVELGEQDSWDKDSFNALAEKFGLMPSGVLESLNDAALDNFDDEVLFDEENIEVNREVLEEMLA